MSDKQIAQLNIYQKLAKIRKQVEVVQKNKSGYGYKYVTDDELLAKISAFMDKYGVSLIPRVTPGTMEVHPYTYNKTKKDRNKDGTLFTYEEAVNEIMVNADMTYEWVNNENPEDRVSVDWALVGHQNDGSQSFGSALTYSMRYFLLKFFSIATPEDDPDNWRSKQHAAEVAEDKAIADGIIANFDEKLRKFLSDNPGKADDVKKFVCKYVKNGNYFTITESVVAGKLLDDFESNFIKGE